MVKWKTNKNRPLASNLEIQKLIQRRFREESTDKCSCVVKSSLRVHHVQCNVYCADFSITLVGMYDVVLCSLHSSEHAHYA